MGTDYLRLYDRIQVPAFVEHGMEAREGLQAPPEPALGALYPLGHGAAQPVSGGYQGQYAVSLAKVVSAQDDRLFLVSGQAAYSSWMLP
jgi:hypothetical protein